ncbi:MAG: dTDP-4-dehydrorhamnose 3,5-epimerase family protein [Mycobacteriales bacterium]
MEITELAVPGAWLVSPVVHRDDRGAFLEWFRADALAKAVGHGLALAQANLSVSRAGVLRGVHFAAVPPGQAKYVTCPRGAILDVAVDLRRGSPTFGQSATVQLDEDNRRGLYLAEGLGHAFLSLADETTVTYLCSTAYNPAVEFTVHALDPALALPWPAAPAALLSTRDAAAPALAAAAEQGMLPDWTACQARYADLRYADLRGGQ